MRGSEDSIHKAVADHLRHRGAAGLVWWHSPNDAKRSFATAARLKKMGMRAGVADIIAIHNGKAFALELKSDNGRATIAQLEFLSDFEQAGGYSCLCHGLDAAIRTLETWGLLRTQRH